MESRHQKSLRLKHEALVERLAELGANDTKSQRNALVADNDIAWEIGDFDDGDKPFSQDLRDGLLVRSRRDSLTAALNSADALDAIARLEIKIQQLQSLVIFSAVVICVLAAKSFFG